MPEPAFKYVAAVEGHMVPRFGTGTFIGATIAKPGEIAWRDGEVVAIPLAEWARYAREYGRIVDAGGLVAKTQADYDAWQKREAEEAAPKPTAEEGEGKGSVTLEPQPAGVGGDLPTIVEGAQQEHEAPATGEPAKLVEGGLLVEEPKNEQSATRSPKSKRT